MSKRIRFSGAQVEEFAKFLAEIVRQGVTYSVEEGYECWYVELTGGF